MQRYNNSTSKVDIQPCLNLSKPFDAWLMPLYHCRSSIAVSMLPLKHCYRRASSSTVKKVFMTFNCVFLAFTNTLLVRTNLLTKLIIRKLPFREALLRKIYVLPLCFPAAYHQITVKNWP